MALASLKINDRVRGVVYAVVLLWVNAYICRDWLFHPTAWMHTIHGSWAAIARLGEGWLQPTWWPFWDFGIPFEFTSPPIVPAMAAAMAPLRGGSHLMAVQAVSAIFYCAAPLALFATAWALTGTVEYSFLAGLFYSLLSPAQILAPEAAFAWADFLSPHRFLLQALWNETPRAAALTFLLLFLFFFFVRTGARCAAAAAVSLALAMLASPFALLSAIFAVACLFTVRPPSKAQLVRAAGIGLLAWALAACFLPPSVWVAIGAASAAREPWNWSVIQSYAGLAVVWFTLVHFIERRRGDWRIPFFVLLTFAIGCGPVLSRWMGRHILPQAHGFRTEMEAAGALLVVFGLRPWISRAPRPAQGVLALAALWLAGSQVIHHRRLAKDVLYPADVTQTIEYRTARRVARELPGVRVMLPGSIAHWANAFTDVPQFSGSEGAMAYSQVQQRVMAAIYKGGEDSLTWLESYGASAVAVSGPASRESWKPFARPEMFEGALPVLWREEGVTVYRVPAVTPLLEWQSRNHVRLRVPGPWFSVPISYHPGWHATVNGKAAGVHRDHLGLIGLEVAGPSDADLYYDGGWELRICRWLSLAAVLATAFLLAR